MHVLGKQSLHGKVAHRDMQLMLGSYYTSWIQGLARILYEMSNACNLEQKLH